MAYTVVDKGSKHFNIILRNGGGGTFTGLGFQPDLVWQKARSSASSHYLHDAVRGVQKALFTNSTSSETTYTDQLTSFDTDGFTVNAGGDWGSGTTVVDWCWKANGAGSSNTAGSISSTVSANTTAGFSIVSYTGDGVNNRTVGHGLGVTPKFIIIKNRDNGTAFWSVINPRSTSTTDTNILYLNRTDAEADDTNIMGTNLPNSTTFGIGDYAGVNVNGNKHIAYCFADVKGFSKFGSYTGNGSSSGNFIYTGFKPAFVLIKPTSSIDNWWIIDNKRDGYNKQYKLITPNTNGAEDTANSGVTDMDLLSNGFRLTTNWSGWNNSGQTVMYACFAESPFVSSKGIPTTAR